MTTAKVIDGLLWRSIPAEIIVAKPEAEVSGIRAKHDARESCPRGESPVTIHRSLRVKVDRVRAFNRSTGVSSSFPHQEAAA